MPGVLVFADTAGGQLSPVSMEVAAAGARLAQAWGEPLLGAVIGNDAAAQEFRGGFSACHAVGGEHFRPYAAQAFIEAAEAVIAACSPSAVLFAHTLETREWVPRLAARLDTGLVMDCVAFDTEGSDLVATKPVYGGSVRAEFVIRGTPRMATVRASTFEPVAATGAGEVVRLAVDPPARQRVRLLEECIATGTGPKLRDAAIIVSGGRGVGGPENWHHIESTAAALNAAVGCSRPVADAGWVPSAHQVGLSGTMVAPQLYIAVGISGAAQHLAGISGARTVVAINTDAEADIFTRASYGVVGDYREVLPAFLERVKQVKK